MKRTIQINLFGTVYNIDEDAQQLLERYITNMKSYFSHQEGGDEIADDLEHRIAELFWNLKQGGTQSISIEQVTEILHNIGNPEEMGSEADTAQSGQPKPEAHDEESQTKPEAERSERRYYRDTQDKVMGGVLSGACRYFGWRDPLALRIIFVLLCLVTEGVLVWAYLVMWLIAPKASTCEQRLKMQGKAVTPDNIRAEVLSHEQHAAPEKNHSGCLKVLLGAIIAPFGCIGIFVVFMIICVLISLIAGLFGATVGLTTSSASLAGLIMGNKLNLILVLLCGIVLVALPVYALYRWLHRDTRELSTTTLIILGGCWLLALMLGMQRASQARNNFRNFDWSNWMISYDWDNGIDAQGERVDYVSPFTAIDIEGVGDVIYRHGDSYKITRRGSDPLLSHTIYSIDDDGTLRISNTHDDEDIRVASNVQIIITAPTLTAVRMQGVGQLTMADTLRSQEPVTLSLEGVGQMHVHYIEAPRISVNNQGVGASDIHVNCDSLIAELQGIGAMRIEGQTRYYRRNDTEHLGNIKDSGLSIIE